MSDRPPPQVIRPGPVRGARAAAASAANTAGVRRNLFQSQLMSRRHPTPPLTSNNSSSNHNHTATTGAAGGTGTGSTSSGSGSGSTIRLDNTSVEVLSDDAGSSLEIVVRDHNGEFEVGDPPTPPLMLDDPDAEEAGGGALDDALENERERHRLAEAVRHYQISHNQAHRHPEEEVLEILKASMRAQVAALGEDNWMFEAEEPVRP